jgi:16S rRNA (guanine1207-N2)-methyltransferase
VFSHAKFDEGARTLIELAQFGPQDALLDLGCGYGAVGIVLAARMPGGRVTMVDSNARAVALAQENALLNGVAIASVVLSDTVSLPDGPASFDRILANPPYFSNYRISELFVRQALRLLKDGGTLQLVTQSPAPHLELFSKAFGNSDVQRKRGYSVVIGRKSATS